MSQWQDHDRSAPDKGQTPTTMERIVTFIEQENILCKAPGSWSRPERGMRFDVNAADGSGYSGLHRFDNGLEVWHSDQLRNKPLRYHFTNIHTYFGFSLMLDGHLDIDIPQLDRKVRIHAGEIAFRRGRVAKIEQTLPAGTRLRSLSMEIPEPMLNAWQSNAPGDLAPGIHTLLRDTRAPVLRIFPADQALVLLAERMLDTETKNPSGRLLFQASALSLLARLLDPARPLAVHLTRSQRRQAHLQQVLDQAIDILRLEWSSPPTIAELARRTGVNERTLQDEFRQRTGQTIGDYARRQRLERARELIDGKGIGVRDAALHVGYSNPSHFSNAYRRYFGHLPSVRRYTQ